MKNIDITTAKKAYEEYIYKCNNSFSKKSLWWYIPSSSRERLGSIVQDKFIDHVIDRKSSEKKDLKDLTWKLKFGNKFPFLKSILSLIRDSFILIKILLLKKNIDTNKNIDLVFVHPIHNLPIRRVDSKIWNHYFGELPSYLVSLGNKVEVLGPLDPDLFLKNEIFEDKNYTISNILFFFKLRDILKLYSNLFCFIFSFKTFPQANNELEKKLKQLIGMEVKTKAYNLFWGLVYQISFERYIKLRKPKFVFHTYENNWWERAINRACEENPGIVKKQVGYLHCSILDSHMKYTLLKDEWNLKPSPDEILVTGPVAKEILLRRGHYPTEKIRVGYDLRGPNLYQIKQKENRPKKLNHILVLLEGLNTMPKFLRLVLETLGELDYKLSVRCHPVFPIKQPEFREVREHRLFSKLTVTQKTTLDEDLEKADLVIYKGTTSALYAGYMGIPLMKFADEWWASDDPLVGCSAFKKEFSNSIELLKGIEYFADMTDEIYKQEKTFLQKYVFDYMRPYTESELKQFANELIS